MVDGRIAQRGGMRDQGASLALVAIVAASARSPTRPTPPERPSRHRLARAGARRRRRCAARTITSTRPTSSTSATSASVRASPSAPARPRFQCRLDGAAWKRLPARRSPSRARRRQPQLLGPRPGRLGRRSTAARFRWTRARAEGLLDRAAARRPRRRSIPGAPPQPLPLLIDQPEPGPDPRHQPAGHGHRRSARLRQRREPRADPGPAPRSAAPLKVAGRRLGEPAGAGRLGADDRAA